MSKRGILPQSRHHVILYDEDWDYLSKLYGPRGIKSSVSISEAVKNIIHQKVSQLRARQIELFTKSSQTISHVTEGTNL